jgi:hypothetical protein
MAANFRFVSDGHGGTIVYDPPVTKGQTLGATVVHDSGPAPDNNYGAGVPNEGFTQAGGDGSLPGAFGESASGTPAVGGHDRA